MGDCSTVVECISDAEHLPCLGLEDRLTPEFIFTDILKLTLVHPSFSLTHLQSKPGQLMKKAL
jgi:hypothetical protein